MTNSLTQKLTQNKGCHGSPNLRHADYKEQPIITQTTMNTTNDSPNHNGTNGNGHSANGANDHGILHWFENFFKSNRLPKPKSAAGDDTHRDWRSTPNAGFRPDGTYNHDKPTDGESQWGIRGVIPSVSFGMPGTEIAEFKRSSRVAAIVGQPIEAVRECGRQRFDARWAQCRAQFETRIASGKRIVDDLLERVEARQPEVKALPVTISDPTRTFAWPRDYRAFLLVFYIVIWLGIVFADWYLIASKQFETAGEERIPLISMFSWIAVPFLLKWSLFSRTGRVAERILAIFKSSAVTILFVFAFVYARYGLPTSSTEQASTLSSMMSGVPNAAANGNDFQWLVFFFQILLCLFTSTALTVQIRELIVGRTVTITNPDRQRMEGEIAELYLPVNQESADMAPHIGFLAEYHASCARFIEHGERVWQAVQFDRELIERERQMLARERQVIEQQRRLLEG